MAACAHDDDLLRRNALELVSVDQIFVVDVQITELTRNVSVLNHGTAGHDHLSPIRNSCIANLLHAMDVTGEGSNDDATFRLLDDALETLANFAL